MAAWLGEITVKPLSSHVRTNISMQKWNNFCATSEDFVWSATILRFVRSSHAYIRCSHMHCHGYAENCVKTAGPPLNKKTGHVPHAYVYEQVQASLSTLKAYSQLMHLACASGRCALECVLEHIYTCFQSSPAYSTSYVLIAMLCY